MIKEVTLRIYYSSFTMVSNLDNSIIQLVQVA